jgi:hypothetical protein
MNGKTIKNAKRPRIQRDQEERHMKEFNEIREKDNKILPSLANCVKGKIR